MSVVRSPAMGLPASPTDVGRVVDDQNQIDCGTTCSGGYPWGCDVGLGCEYTPVTLTASDLNGWRIYSWTGCDSTTTDGTCSIDAPKDVGGVGKQVTAYFADVGAPSLSLTSPPAAGTHVRALQLKTSESDNDKLSSLKFYARQGAVYIYDGSTITDPGGTAAHTFGFSGLADGTYAFGAEARDYAGNITRSEVTLVLDRTVSAPQLDPLPAWTNQASATVTWGALDADASATCRVGTVGSFAACASGWAAALSEGANTLVVRATDGAGNTADTQRTINVDTAVPTVAIAGGPSAFTLTLDGTGSTASATCHVDDAAPADCSGGSFTADGLADGTHTLHVRVTDQAGNSADASRAFTVESPPVTTPDPITTPTAPPAAETPPAATPPAHLAAQLQHSWRLRRGKLTVRSLLLTGLPHGAKVTIACTGKGRPFTRRTFTAHGVVDLHQAFRKPLRAGVSVVITITDPGYVPERLSFTTTRARTPKVRGA